MPVTPDLDGRPAKRARLEPATESTTESTTTSAASTELPKAPIDSGPAAVDGDLERELRAGITEYVCPDNLGFTGVLKQRYTDFLVNEIGPDGKVLHLKVAGVEKKKVDKEVANGDQTERKVKPAPEAKVEVRTEDTIADAPPQQDVAAEVKAGDVNTGDEVNGEGETQQDKQEEQQVCRSILRRFPPLTQVQLSEEDLGTLHSIFGKATTSEIISLVRVIRRKEDRKAKDFKVVHALPIEDKDVRTEAHRCLRRIFPNMLESYMQEDKSIRIKAIPPQERKSKNKRGGGERGQGSAGRKGALAWDELGGEFLHFTLYKENKNTMEVVGFIGAKLKCGQNAITYAGTKDRRACTTQRLCIKRQTAERLNPLNKVLFNSAIGDYSYHNHALKLGDAAGNEFTITLRDCQFQGDHGLDIEQRILLANKILEKATADFSEKGFINYFGLQRFGSFAASTDMVGLKIIQGDLKGAVEDLLAFTDSALAAANGTGNPNLLVSQDDRDRAKALHIWKTSQRGSEVLDMLPKNCNAERNIIQHLSSRNGSSGGKRDRMTDWQGALMTLPRNLRLIYVHAYQSLVWNVAAGKRWTTYGDNVVEGDLVLVNEHKDKEESTQCATDQTIDQDGEMIINPEGADSALAGEEDFERARPLTAEEAASGKYTVYDIVLPQVGYDVEYPKNRIGQFYKEFMASERGGGLDPHNMRRSWREASLPGSYRKFLARPLDSSVSYEVHDYTKVNEQFVETDLDRLRKNGQRGLGAANDRGKPKEEAKDAKMGEAEEEDVKIAVVIKLQLGTSTYATVALRELMKPGGVQAYKPEFLGGR
jgi:tRNA pseudouridine13 synthase